MSKTKSLIARRTWNVLRLALLWARKGGAFKRGLMMELRVVPKYIKSIRNAKARNSTYYKEKEFLFDETPLFDFKMHRPNSMRFQMPSLSCLKPQVDFDDFDYIERNEREEDYGLQHCEDERLHDEIVEVEDGIDVKADEFIAKFYEQMKLQR